MSKKVKDTITTYSMTANSDNMIKTTINLNDDGTYAETKENIEKMTTFTPPTPYDYKKNLEHLRKRYENKIKYLDSIRMEYSNYNDGIIDGLKNALHDIDDMLNGLEV